MTASLGISTTSMDLSGSHPHFSERQLPTTINTEPAILSATCSRRPRPVSRQPYQHHDRSRDTFHILQSIVQEIDRREREEAAATGHSPPKSSAVRRSSVPGILITSPSPSVTNNTTNLPTATLSSSSPVTTATPSISTPPMRTVRFSTEPPRVFRKSTLLWGRRP